MKDAVILVPVFTVGAFALVGASESTWNHQQNLPFYLLFLAFLFAILVAWYRGKVRAAERPRRVEETGTAARLNWTPGRSVVMVGAGLPVGLFTVAWMASLTTHAEPAVIWLSAAVVAVTALLCGTFLLVRLPSLLNGAPHRAYNGKAPEYDPDAFDVVGRRG